jgi:hypothetical protein
MSNRPNQESLKPARCVRLTMSPDCRYSAFSSRAARSVSSPASRPSPACHALALQPLHRGHERAGDAQHAEIEAGRNAIGHVAGDLGQQRAARAAQREFPQDRPQRVVMLVFAHQGQLLVAGRPQDGGLDMQHTQLGGPLEQQRVEVDRAVHEALEREHREGTTESPICRWITTCCEWRTQAASTSSASDAWPRMLERLRSASNDWLSAGWRTAVSSDPARSRAAWFMEVALKVADPHELRLAKGDGGFEQTHTKG